MKLLPCPFCGGDAEVVQLGTGRQSCQVACTNCSCTLESNENGAGYYWNHRGPSGTITTGTVVCDAAGLPVWVGNPENTDSPRLTVYDSLDPARRALTRIWKATRWHTGDRSPYRLARVQLVVLALGDLITPKVRDDT